jgi:hypothetical protein
MRQFCDYLDLLDSAVDETNGSICQCADHQSDGILP